MAIGGILPRDASWSIYWVLTKETNKFYNQNVQSHSLYIYIKYDIRWTVANGSLNPDLFFLDTVHLVEKGNQKLAK